MDQFRAALELLPEALLLLSRDAVIQFANQPAAAVFAHEGAELSGHGLGEFIEEPESELAALTKQWARSGQLLPAILTVRNRAGAGIKYRCEGARIGSPDGQGPLLLRMIPRDASIARFILLNQRIDQLGREISRRQRAEAAVDEQRKTIKVTLSSIGDAVIATDEVGRITFMNGVAETFTQWTLEEATGKPLHEVFVIINEQTRASVQNPVQKVIESGAIVGLANHTILIRKDGSEVPIDDSAAPIRDENGKVFGVVLVFRDITERRATERSRIEADRRKDEFLAMLAHELRNPLAVIANNVGLLHRVPKEAIEEKQARRLAVIGSMLERQTRHLTRLVDDLLDVSRITSGKIALRMSTQPLGPIIAHAIEMAGHIIKERNIEIQVEAPPGPVSVHGDFERLAQVFSNLLTNASKFSPSGGRIFVSTEDSSSEVVVRVRDNGVGIESTMLEAIFELFRQADESFGSKQGGLGVGLTIVQSLVQMHGGSIQAYSEGLGRGSEFAVRLPTPPAHHTEPDAGR